MTAERVTPGMLRIVAAGNRGRFGNTSLAETLDNAAATMGVYEARIAELEEVTDAMCAAALEAERAQRWHSDELRVWAMLAAAREAARGR